MKYKGINTRSGHTLFIRKRESAFDAKDRTKSKFGDFSDHAEMKTWEYAAFQKEQFAHIKKRRKHFFLRVLAATAIAFLLLFLIPYIIEFVRTFSQKGF